MSNLDFIKKNANKYNLVAEYVRKDTLKVYSPKYDFDSWLVVETEEEIQLLHLSKNGGIKKCSYHLHATIRKRNSIRVLQRINTHNRYVAFHKKYNKTNLVDRVLAKEQEKRIKFD